MNLLKKTTATVALLAIASSFFNVTSAYSTEEVNAANKLANTQFGDETIIVKKENPADYQLDRNVDRDEIAGVSRKLAKLEKATTCKGTFTDVTATTPNDWACSSVEPLADNGYITTANKTFRPKDSITKAEAVGMIIKAAYGDEYKYDAAKGDWQKQTVDFAVSKKIVDNFTNYTTPATRGFVFGVAAKTLTSDPVCEILGECNNSGDTETPVVKDGKLTVSLSAQTPANGNVVVGADRTKLLAFEVTADKKSDVTLQSVNLKFTGLGEAQCLSNLALYSNDIKATKNEGSFNTKNEATVSFNRDTVVKAGETKTFFVTTKVAENVTVNGNSVDCTANQTYRVNLTDLKADVNVTGATLTGATLTPMVVNNKWDITVTTSGVNADVKLGEEATLYEFDVKETSKREDLVVKSVTFDVSGAIKWTDLKWLKFKINDKEVEADFQKSVVTFVFEDTVKAGQKNQYTLTWEVNWELEEDLVLQLKEVQTVGATTGIAIDWKQTDPNDPTVNIAAKSKLTVKGAEVNLVFKDLLEEASSDDSDIVIARFELTSKEVYEAEVQVEIKAGDTNLEDNSLKINGIQADNRNWNIYTWRTIDTTEKTFEVTADTTDNATGSVKVEIKVTKLTHEDSETVYNNPSEILNTTSKPVSFDIKDTKITLKADAQEVNDYSMGNPILLYKGEIKLTGSETVTITKAEFKNNTSVSLQANIEDVVLTIGWEQIKKVNVTSDTITFSSPNAKVSDKKVPVMLVAKLKDTTVASNSVIEIKNATLTYKTNKNSGITTTTNIASNIANLKSNSTIDFGKDLTRSADYVLAWAPATIWKFKIVQNVGDSKFKEGEFKIGVKGTGNGFNILNAAEEITLKIEGVGEIEAEYDAVKHVIQNTGDSFTLTQSATPRKVEIVAKLRAFNGNNATNTLWEIELWNVRASSTDLGTSEVYNPEMKTVTVVPVILTASIKGSDRLGKDGDDKATVNVKFDNSANNTFREAILKSVTTTPNTTTVKHEGSLIGTWVEIGGEFDLTITASTDWNYTLKTLTVDVDGYEYNIDQEDLDLGKYTN